MGRMGVTERVRCRGWGRGPGKNLRGSNRQGTHKDLLMRPIWESEYLASCPSLWSGLSGPHFPRLQRLG